MRNPSEVLPKGHRLRKDVPEPVECWLLVPKFPKEDGEDKLVCTIPPGMSTLERWRIFEMVRGSELYGD